MISLNQKLTITYDDFYNKKSYESLISMLPYVPSTNESTNELIIIIIWFDQLFKSYPLPTKTATITFYLKLK